MSNVTTTTTTLPSQRLGAAIATAVIAIGALAVSYYPFDQADDGGPRAILIVSGIVLALTAFVFGKVLDRPSTRTAIPAGAVPAASGSGVPVLSCLLPRGWFKGSRKPAATL